MRTKPEPLSKPEVGVAPGRPTPVRQLMEGGDESAVPIRPFESEGEEWVVRVLGSTSAGMAPDVRAPILLVGFARGSDPDTLAREAMVAAVSLDDLSDDDLMGLLARSREARSSDGSSETGGPVSVRHD